MTYADCRTSESKNQFIHNALHDGMGLFLSGFSSVTDTEVSDWATVYRHNSVTNTTDAVTITHKPTGAAFFIHIFSGRFSVSPSLPRFAFGYYKLSELCPRGVEVPNSPTFAADRLASNPFRIGKEAGKRLGVPVLALWHYVTERLAQESAIINGREAAIKYLKAHGWTVRAASGSKEHYATKKGCKELKVSETGTVSFYYPHFSASVEAMAQAAELLGVEG